MSEYVCESCANCLGLRIPRTIDTCGTVRTPKAYVDCSATRKSVWTMRAKEYDGMTLPWRICGSYRERRA